MSNFINAQNKIVGVFNPVSKTFETDNKTYWIDFFENGVARIYEDGYAGLVDSAGTILCEPKYDEIFISDKGVYRVSLSNKYGLLSNKGKELISPSLVKISDFNLGLAIYTQSEEKFGQNRFGIIKSDGTFLTKAEYVLLLPRDGFGYFFTKNEQVGLIDYNGKEITVYNKKDINQAIIDNVIRIDQGIIRKLDNCSPEGRINTELLKFNEGLTITFKKIGDCYKYGFMNKDFKTVITPKYDWVEEFKNGYAIVSNKDKWGVIDINGNQTITSKYTSIKQINKDRFVVCSNNKYGVINNKNQIVIPIKYKPIFGLADNLYVTHNGKKWGVIDEKEKLILPFEYDGVTSGVATKYEGIFSLPTGLIKQTLYGKGHYFDSLGKIENDSFRFSVYVEVFHSFLSNPGLFLPMPPFAKSANDTAITNEINKATQYDFNEKLKNGYQIIGKEIANMLSIHAYSVPVLFPKKKYLKGIMDNMGEIIVPVTYHEIINQGTNLFTVMLNRKWGVIDLKNNLIFPIDYDYVQIGRGIAILSKKNNLGELESGVFDFFGKELIPYSKSFYQIIEGNMLLKEESVTIRYMIDKKGNKINME